MNAYNLKYHLIGLFFLLFIADAFSQSLLQSRRNSYYKYIYALSSDQAGQIHKKGLNEVDESWFMHVVDSIPYDSAFVKEMDKGDYLFVWVEDNALNYEFRSFSDVQLILHNNYADLAFTLHEKDGSAIQDAVVRIKNRKIRFKHATQNYHWPDKHFKGTVEVLHKGLTSYYYIDNLVKKGSVCRKILFSFPLKYISIPLKQVLYLPYDIYRSIRFNALYGLPYYSIQPFKDIYYSIYDGYPRGVVEKVSRCFDKERKWDKGYTVFSKPLYKPGDTVRVKAYICKDNGRPYDKDLNVYCRNNGRQLPGKAKHDRKGAYYFDFVLCDSMNLKLDQYVTLFFGPKKQTRLAVGSFKYEDYELKTITYTLKTGQSDYKRGDTLRVTAKGEDANGCQIPDGRIHLLILNDKQAREFTDRLVHIPDTLWHCEQNLNSSGETELIIPGRIFPNINARYKVIAHFTGTENESVTKTNTINYWNSKKEIISSRLNKYLQITYLNLHDTIRKEAVLQTLNINNLVISEQNIQLPATIKINPFCSGYRVLTDDLEHRYQLSEDQPQLSFSLSRNHRAMMIQSYNPEDISFYYSMYKKDKLLCKGYTNRLDTLVKAGNTANYFLSVQYMWGGQSISQDYTIPIKEKQLKLSVESPGLINPGQGKTITVKATDYKNRPVANVDLTAMSLSGKFDYSPPSLPYFGKTKPNRSMYSNYVNKADTQDGTSSSAALNYALWNARMQLDSIEYYKFIYPPEGFYQTSCFTKEHKTQVAPFVFIAGRLQQAHIIWINNRIVYASVDNTNPPYSFLCSSGYINISIRTDKYDISLKDVSIVPHKKNIISIDPLNYPKATIREMPNTFTAAEKARLGKAYSPFIVNENNSVVYTKQEDDIRLLKVPGVNNYLRRLIAGPFTALTPIDYYGSSHATFDHDYGYSYEIKGRMLKLKSNLRTLSFLNHSLTDKPTVPGLWDEALTQKQMDELVKKNKQISIARRPVFYNPQRTEPGNTRLNIRYTEKPDSGNTTIYTLLFSNDNPEFIRIHNGLNSVFRNLESGNYRLLFVLNNGCCFEEDSIRLQAGGHHYLQVTEPDTLKSDDTVERITALIEKHDNSLSAVGQDMVKNAVLRAANWETAREGTLIKGRVSDREGLPVPGAMVMVENTNFGTLTDIDGKYELSVPGGANSITAVFIGYKQQNVSISNGRYINIILEEKEVHLDEVVVTGYSSIKKESYTSSITSVNSLQSQAAGIRIMPLANAGKMRIGGDSSFGNTNTPLIIIDGILYEGDLSQLNAADIESAEVLEEDSATRIYGSRAAGGVIIVSLKNNTVIPFKKSTWKKRVELGLPANNKGLRSNFKDVAFWQPSLFTDKNGEAHFTVSYPDDITNWHAHVLAMSPKGHTGTWKGQTQSFLPLSANLSLPSFITEGDSVTISGKTLNYLADSVSVKRQFELNGTRVFGTKGSVDRFAVDRLNIEAGKQDTITVKYSLNKADYKDGEERKIPVQTKGTFDNIGHFTVLDNDSAVTLRLNPNIETEFYIQSNPADVFLNECAHLRRYVYLCNEQAASKLIGLLIEKKIRLAREEVFKYEADVKKLIKRLEKSRNNDRLWGWWPANPTSSEVSTHVLTALQLAQDNGYETDINKDDVGRQLVSRFHAATSNHDRLSILSTLSTLNLRADIEYMSEQINRSHFSFNDSVRYFLIRQQIGLKDDINQLVDRRDSTLYGSVFWGGNRYSLFNNRIISTLLMYRLIKDREAYRHLLRGIRNYFFEQRKGGYWGNTYYSSGLMYYLADDYLQLPDGKRGKNSEISITYNSDTESINRYPYSLTCKTDEITIHKTGRQTLFVGTTQKVFNPAPEAKDDLFEISTSWNDNGKPVLQLTAGKEYSLKVDINIKKDSEYIKLEIPLPAGCSYADKPHKHRSESHREYYKEKVNVYYRNLHPGKRTIEIKLIPRFKGSFTINPATMESMYFPTLYGRNGVKKIVVKDL